MAKINNYVVVKRYDRPSPNSKAYLEFLFVKDGILQDPYQVCSVHIFPDSSNGDITAFVDSELGSPTYGEIEVSSANASASFIFTNTTGGSQDPDPQNALDPSAYTPGTNASGIYKIGDGHFAVVLTPNEQYYDWYGTAAASNGASAIGNYLDVWTIVATPGSLAKTFVNQFELFNEGAFALTELPLITITHEMKNKYIPVGSNERLKITTEYSTENRRTDQELTSLLQDSGLLSDVQMKITKLNESPDLTSRVVIQDFSDTSGSINMNTENVISYLWDTGNITAKDSEDILGGTRGIYEVQIKYNVFTETRYSPRFTVAVH
jgi:hypothetical protein